MALPNLGRWLRNEADNIGSFVTGQPAHGAPVPAPAPQIQRPTFNPAQGLPNAPSFNGASLGSLNSNPIKVGTPSSTVPHSSVYPAPTNHVMTNSSPIRLGSVAVHNPQMNRQVQPYQTPGFVTNVIQPITRTVPEIGATLINKQYHPGSGIEKAVFGKTNVQPVQQTAAGVYHAVQAGHQTLPGGIPISPKLAVPYAAANVAVHALNDLPVVGTAIKGIKLGVEGAKAALPEATSGFSKLAADQGGFLKLGSPKPTTPRVSVAEQNTLRDYSDHLVGANKANGTELNNLIATARQIGARHGIDLTNGTVADRLDRVNGILDNVGKPRMGLTPLNQTGAIGKDVSGIEGSPEIDPNKGLIVKEGRPLPDGTKPIIRRVKDPKTGKVQLVQQLVDKNTDKPMKPNLNEGAFSPEDTAKLDKLNAKQQAELAKRPLPKPAPKQFTVEENTARNPMKLDVPNVKPGDYEKARSNYQLASNPIDYATGQAYKAVKSLSKEQKARFWDAVENPETIGNDAKLRDAVTRWNDLTNRTHATSQSLGGNTNYLENYARHNWDLSKPEDAARFQELINSRKGIDADPYAFGGIDRQPRVFKTVAEGRGAGFRLKNPLAPEEDILAYGKGVSNTLGKQALIKGMTEADQLEPLHNRSFDLGDGRTIPLSDKGINELRSFVKSPEVGKPLKTYRTINRKTKQTILSASEFHPINITAYKAMPGLAAEGHPILAAKGLYATGRAQIGTKYSDTLQQSFLKDKIPAITDNGKTEISTVDAAARIGTPIKYGSDYESSGKLNIGKAGIGEHTIFEKAMPAGHGQMVKGVVADLTKKGISLDSPEARAAGTRINEIMGFVNTEMRNLDKGHQKFLGDIAFAPQFTRAKWATLKGMFEGGVAGSYARRTVGASVIAEAATALAIGYVLKQKSDDIRDVLLRSIFAPAVPTGYKDSKGNNVELKMPATYTSEALGLVATLKRGQDGHLHVDWSPSNLVSNAQNYGRSRLAVVPSNVLKVKTNTSYAGKPLYDPSAPKSQQAIQAATSVATGLLPIGAQGVAETKAGKAVLPKSSREVIEANKSTTNPLVKSIASAFGFTPTTDKTVGKGEQTTQYFDALNSATKGLNSNDKSAFQTIHPQSKNPVTGAYQVQPTVFDTGEKANIYLAHPNVLAADVKLNQALASQGQTVDPFYTKLTPAQQQAVLVHGTINKNNTQQLTAWNQQNPWYSQFQQDRSVFYNSLPPGDPNKPKNPIQPPTQTQSIQDLYKQYDTLSNPTDKAAFFGAHPELSDYESKVADYTNSVLQAQGLTPLKKFPTADPQTASFTSAYMNGTPAQRAALKTGNPQGYQGMEAYLQNVSEYQVAKNGALDQLQGQTPNQQLLKGINSLATYDMVKNPDGSLALKYGNVNPGATSYGSVSTVPQAGAVAMGAGSGKTKRVKYRKAYVKHISKKHIKKPHVFLNVPPSIVKIRNKAPQHVGIKRTTYR